MAASQFDSPAHLMGGGRINVEGPQQFEAMAAGFPPKVEYRFLLVQEGKVVKGSGEGWSATKWFGSTDEGQEPLQKGPVLAIGLAIITSTDDPPGFTTFSWSEQIELVGEETSPTRPPPASPSTSSTSE
jgi:hypothetical protein